jgi:hypothetical protein
LAGEIQKFKELVKSSLDLESNNYSRFYHYTSYSGVEGILTSGNIRLYNLFSQDRDFYELRHGLQIFADVAKEYSTHQKETLRLFNSKLIEFSERGYDKVAKFYICCFSELGNDPNQWTEFGNNGVGCCLQFSPKLKDHFEDYGGLVTYDSTSLHLGFSDLLKRAALTIENAPYEIISNPKNLNNFLIEITYEVLLKVIPCCLFYKPIKFSHENEFRFLDVYNIYDVGRNRKALKQNSDQNGNNFIEYIFNKEDIEAIWITNKFDNPEKLEKLLQRLKLNQIEIKRTN